MTFTVASDPNVLYPNTLRDLLIRIARSERSRPSGHNQPIRQVAPTLPLTSVNSVVSMSVVV
jgi:hypothetical protein